MLFTFTTIRLSIDEHKFENTEVNQIGLIGDVEKELRSNGCDFDQLVKLQLMKPSDSKVFENTIYNGIEKGIRFTYVHCIK